LKTILLSIALIATTIAFLPQHVYAQESREQLLESALINRYNPLLDKQINSSYYCTTVVSIKRLGEPNQFAPKFDVKLRTVTYSGAHNPPHDLITADIVDDPYGAKIVHMVRVPNVSSEVIKAQCQQEKVKMQLHTHQFR
jgi:hypothetical protein